MTPGTTPGTELDIDGWMGPGLLLLPPRGAMGQTVHLLSFPFLRILSFRGVRNRSSGLSAYNPPNYPTNNNNNGKHHLFEPHGNLLKFL